MVLTVTTQQELTGLLEANRTVVVFVSCESPRDYSFSDLFHRFSESNYSKGAICIKVPTEIYSQNPVINEPKVIVYVNNNPLARWQGCGGFLDFIRPRLSQKL